MSLILFLQGAAQAAQAPIPRDLSLPLPFSSDTLEILIVVLFLAHILFVNLMVGGSVLTVFFEILGLYRPRYDKLAQRIGATITVNKSLAVVLGVGPLLAINLLYTVWFYSANALTGTAWIAIVPLVILAFLLSYLHKYTWDKWRGPFKKHHIVPGAMAALLFLTIPLIFLSNINLMLFPGRWIDVNGFFSTLQIGNVFPRYFHFVTASLAITALFLAGWFGRKGFPVEATMPGFSHPQLRRLFYRLAFWVTIAQLVFGPLLFATLPDTGITLKLLLIVLSGITLAIMVLFLLWYEIRSSDERIGRYYIPLLAIFGVLVLFMATGRHVYREAAITDHRQLVYDRTRQFEAVELAALMRQKAGLGVGEALAEGPTGKSVFQNCASCHAVDRVLAAPPITEIYSIYKGNPEGIVTWAMNPGKKRPQFGPMPSFKHLGKEKLELVAEYMLELGEEGTQPSDDGGEAAKKSG